MPTAPIRQIRLYTRPGCHLCEDAAEMLAQFAARVPLQIAEVNILEDANLFERYKHSIPVVAIEGGPTLTAPIREADLLRALGALSSGG